jgi:LacI family transcriptional regulator
MQRKNMITVKDIAKALNLHHTTISRALRNNPDIKPETKDLILKKAKSMGYLPNNIASSLRSKTTKTLGIIVPTVHHFIFSEIISELTSLAYNAGYSIFICQSDEKKALEDRNISMLLNKRIDGVFVSLSLETKSLEHFSKFESMEIPIIFFDRVGEINSGMTVTTDNFKGAFIATEFLLQKGYKAIAHLAGPLDTPIFRQRFEGYKAALEKNKVLFRPEFVIEGKVDVKSGKQGAELLLKLKHLPDSILTVTDTVAFGAIKKIKQSGLKIPDDIAVIGFDNDPSGELIEPELTTIAQPIEQIAKECFNMFLASLKHSGKKVNSKVLAPSLIIRKSA